VACDGRYAARRLAVKLEHEEKLSLFVADPSLKLVRK